MPRYCFDIAKDEHVEDSEGVLLDGPQEACAQAVLLAGDMMRDLDGVFWNGAEWGVRVTDEAGQIVCSLKVSGQRGE